jgi:hypothetical protein
MILAQKKTKVFRTQETAGPSQMEQSGAEPGNAPGATDQGAQAAEQSAQAGGRAAAAGQGSESRFEVDLLDCWCKP